MEEEPNGRRDHEENDGNWQKRNLPKQVHLFRSTSFA